MATAVDLGFWEPPLSVFLLLVAAVIVLLTFCCVAVHKYRNRNADRSEYRPLNTRPEPKKAVKGVGSPQEVAALNAAQTYLRNDAEFSLKGPAFEMGTREEKHYFLARDRKGRMHVLTVVKSRISLTRHAKGVEALLGALRHPSLCPSVRSYFSERTNELIVLRPFVERKSIRDMVCQNGKLFPFDEEKLAMMGRQVLEALLFLKSFGMWHGCLTCANILISRGRAALLTDYENGLFGLKPRRPHGRSMEEEDVVAFAHVLYEAGTGEPMAESQYDARSFSPLFPRDVRLVIKVILKPKTSLISLEELVIHPLFAEVELKDDYAVTSVDMDDGMKAAVKFATSVEKDAFARDTTSGLERRGNRQVRKAAVLSASGSSSS